MRKKLTILILVGVALVLLAGPALAAGSGRDSILAKRPQKSILSLTGTIVGDPSNGIITVDVQMTNKPYLYLRSKTDLKVSTDAKTVYIYWGTPPKRGKSTYDIFSSLAAGDRVSINARLQKDGTFLAKRVEVNKPRYP